LLDLESMLPDLKDGDREKWQQYLEKELDVNPRWVWNVDLEGMLVKAKELFESLRQGGENATDA
jgi:salicylate hydroxylase